MAHPELELDPGSGFRCSPPEFKVCTSPLRDLLRAQGLRPAWKRSDSELDVINEGKLLQHLSSWKMLCVRPII